MLKFIATFLTISLLVTSCFQIFDIGQNSKLKETYNNLASKKAILFLKEGNATADNSLQVTVAGYDYELDKKEVGNTFTVDSDHNKTKQDTNSINFTWLTKDTLQIDYDKHLRTFIQEKIIDGVTIIYRAW